MKKNTQLENSISTNQLFSFVIMQFEQHSKKQDAELQANPPAVPNDLFYMKQYIHNACGAIALVHSVANNPE